LAETDMISTDCSSQFQPLGALVYVRGKTGSSSCTDCSTFPGSSGEPGGSNIQPKPHPSIPRSNRHDHDW